MSTKREPRPEAGAKTTRSCGQIAPYGEPGQIRDALVRQIYCPARWVETIQAMGAGGATAMEECGPGKVLAGLNKRIVKEMETYAVFDATTLDEALRQTATQAKA